MQNMLTQETHPSPEACIIWLHGLGASGHDFYDVIPSLKLDPQLKLRFLFPHAPVRPITINQNLPMRGWYDIFSLTDLNKEDMDGLNQSAEFVQNLINDQIQQGIAPTHIFLAGFSQGAALALHTALRLTSQKILTGLGGVIALSGYCPGRKQLNKINTPFPIFMAHGEYDEIIPIVLAKESLMALTHAGFQVDWHSYLMGHHVCDMELEKIGNWLSKIMENKLNNN
jgi:phospholipase/carboxylesterase